MNQVLDQEDKKGDRSVSITPTEPLWDVIDARGLIDMDFSGPRFKWSNNRGGKAKTREHLEESFSDTLC